MYTPLIKFLHWMILSMIPWLVFAQNLEVYNDIRISGPSPIVRLVSNTNQSLGYLLGHSSGATVGAFGDLLLTTSLGGLSSVKMRIKGNGNIGIKTSNPLTKLHILGGEDAS